MNFAVSASNAKAVGANKERVIAGGMGQGRGMRGQFVREAYRPGLHIISSEPDVPIRAAILFFHGGGWHGGNPMQYRPFWPSLLAKGVACATAEYRVMRQHKSTIYDSIDDAKAAVSHLRTRSSVPMFLSGASAGGALALLASLSTPIAGNALFNPVLDLSENGFSNRATPKGGDRSISPLHLSGFPRTLIWQGEADAITPIDTARKFVSTHPHTALVAFPGAEHGFLQEDTYIPRILKRLISFITWVPRKP